MPEHRRVWKNEQYLRSEHLLVKGRYVSVLWTIKDVVYECKGKPKGTDDKPADPKNPPLMLGIEFHESGGRIFGLNRTNESMVDWVTGEGIPSKWIGHKIQLMVRLIPNRSKKNAKEPAIRVWPGKGKQHPRSQVRDEMGEDISEEWYANNSYQPEKVEAPPKEEKKDPPKDAPPKKEFSAETRAKWIETLVLAIDAAKTPEAVTECGSRFNKMAEELKKNGAPLSDDERKRLSDLVSTARKALATPPAAANATPPAEEETPPPGSLL